MQEGRVVFIYSFAAEVQEKDVAKLAFNYGKK